MNIKRNVVVRLKSGRVKKIPFAEVKQYARKNCGFCRDFSSEVADLSAGGLGLEGWTCTITRTKEGENLFKSAAEIGILRTRPFGEDERTLKLLVKLSNRRHK
jgi:coenzyme F420 hydrogenase subunit beta